MGQQARTSVEGIDRFTYPVGNIIVVTVIAGLAGAIAAIVRAARLDVLRALSAE